MISLHLLFHAIECLIVSSQIDEAAVTLSTDELFRELGLLAIGDTLLLKQVGDQIMIVQPQHSPKMLKEQLHVGAFGVDKWFVVY